MKDKVLPFRQDLTFTLDNIAPDFATRAALVEISLKAANKQGQATLEGSPHDA